MSDMENKKEYNFLILGETGVGKSTFINAFVNYINFPTLDDALAAEKIHALIPSRFMIVDADFQSKEIKFGDDKNESFLTGESSTQECRSYKFQFEDVIIRLIDTPGVGDTRGIDRDQANFENLLAYLGEFEEISAIVIMLKPNEARLTVLFEYCIKQLLSSLERSAVDNIVFLFTNSRATFYMPGDTHGPLEIILKKIASVPPHVSVPYNSINTFCMDNEAFRFLLAKRQGSVFLEHAQRSYKESWDVSVSVCKRLIEYVTRLPPHRVQNTVSVMDARRTIEKLREPLGVITELIENNIRRIDRLKENLTDTTKKIEDLGKYLYVPRINLKVEELKYPMTVCASPDCTDAHKIEDSTHIHYKTICHNHCYLQGVPKEVLGDHRLQYCSAMSMRHGVATCNICSHTYHKHKHIYFVTTPYEENKKDENVDKQIGEKNVTKEDIEKELKRHHAEKQEYEKEREIIQKAVAKFAHFLTNSVILPFNDVYKKYMNMLIEREKQLGSLAKQDAIKNFEKIIQRYEEEKAALSAALDEVKTHDASVKTVVSASEVMNIIKDLYDLKLTGKTIKALYDAQQRHMAAELVKQTETVIEPISVGLNTAKNLFSWIGHSLVQTFTTKSKTKTTSKTITGVPPGRTSVPSATSLKAIETESTIPATATPSDLHNPTTE